MTQIVLLSKKSEFLNYLTLEIKRKVDGINNEYILFTYKRSAACCYSKENNAWGSIKGINSKGESEFPPHPKIRGGGFLFLKFG